MGNSNDAFDDLDQLDALMKGKAVPSAAEQQSLDQKQKWALKLISDFAGKSNNGVWPNLRRFNVSTGLAARVQNTFLINQSNTWLCGITSVVRDWAADCPVDYAWLGIQLFDTGRGRLGRGQVLGEIVAPTSDLKNSAVPEGMHQADWLVLASVHETLVKKYGHAMQDALGAIGGLNYSKEEGVLHYRAWQNPSEVVAAFKATGYNNVIDNASPTSYKGVNDVQRANDLLRDGWRVSLLINMRMLGAEYNTTSLTGTSDHWVGMIESINILGEYVYPFEVFSWGKHMRIPSDNALKKIAVKDWIPNFFGFVAGRPY